MTLRRRRCPASGCARAAARRREFCRPHQRVADGLTGFHIPGYALKAGPPAPVDTIPEPPPAQEVGR